MPSGAKKRKAAKKKMEKEANNNNHHQGDDDLKSQDFPESDPLNQHPFDQGNEVFDLNAEVSEKNDHSTIASDATNGKPANEVTDLSAGDLIVEVENDGLIVTIIEKNTEMDVESNYGNIQHATFPKESHNEVHCSFRCTDVDETPVPQMKLDEEAYGSVFNGHSTDTENKIVDSLCKEITQILEIKMPIEDANSNLDVESFPNAGPRYPVLPMSEVIKQELESAEIENAEALELVEEMLRQRQDRLLHESIGVNSISLVETKEDNSLLDENCAVSSDAVIATVNANEGKILTSSGAHAVVPIENGGNHEGSKLEGILPSAENKDKVIPVPDENIESSLDASSASLVADFSGPHAVDAIGTARNNEALETCNITANGSQGTVLKSSVACTAETGYSVQVTQDIETFVSIISQPLIAPAPRVRTSWLNCCGMFEVFSGSSK